jgi:hypothetical protein
MCGYGIGGNEHRLRSEAAQLRGKGVGTHSDPLSTLGPVHPVLYPLLNLSPGGGGVVVERVLILRVVEEDRADKVSGSSNSSGCIWSTKITVDPQQEHEFLSA